jgi:DNA-binding NtrC family response regulator
MKLLKPFLHQNDACASGLCASESPLIYAVDDVPELTRLYTTLLEASGYCVRTFNDRAEVVAALRTDQRKPELLITDYLGHSMPVERFMCHCLDVHPTLRVLMASGFGQRDAEITRARPDRFIQKPFTPEEFRREVSAALAA